MFHMGQKLNLMLKTEDENGKACVWFYGPNTKKGLQD